MDYEGSSFKSNWKDGLLRIRGLQMEQNTLSLLDIILDAAVKQGGFNVAWDLRLMKSPSAYQLFKITQFCHSWKQRLDTHVHRFSILTAPNKEYIFSYIFKVVPPSCPYYLGSNVLDAKRFVI